MKNFRILLSIIAIFTTSHVIAESNLSLHDLDGGWIGMGQQNDPFDTTKFRLVQIFKGDFVLRCGSLNIRSDARTYDGFSFSAKIKYVIDDNKPIDKKGSYSTYINGSDMVTNRRYFSFSLNKQDVTSMKNGTIMRVAGSYGSSGWSTKELSLNGFKSSYEKMCN